MSFLWRGERGRRVSLRALRLPGFFLAALARRRRKKGAYDRPTLALFRSAWARRGTASSFLDYVLFRRDLGYPLPKRRVEAMLAAARKLPASRRPLALALVAEVAPYALGKIPERLLQEGTSTAPLAALSVGRGKEGEAWLASLHERQDEWREGLAALVAGRREKGICIVGNGGNIAGGGDGSWIDGHGLVVRFNRFRSAGSDRADTGERIDIWVCAPGFPSSPPLEVDWAVVTGPDMRFRRRNWGPLRERLESGRPVLTVPLEIWREVVKVTLAPPSAGILALAWLRTLLGGWRGISAVGLGSAPSGSVPYHHADPAQKAVERHHWEAERALLRKWCAEGLHCKR